VRPTAFTLALLLSSLAAVVAAAPAEDAPRAAAQQLGGALVAHDASRLRPILPARGKVRLQLARLGPEQGSFGAGQVEAVFRDALRQVRVQEFTIERLQLAPEGQLALVEARAALTDRAGRPCSTVLHLTLAPEDSRWVLRGIREASR
jgi:hypothetical protein